METPHHTSFHMNQMMDSKWRYRTSRLPSSFLLSSVSREGSVTSSPDLLGRDHSAGPWQRTGTVGERGPAHPNYTLREALQPRWRTSINSSVFSNSFTFALMMTEGFSRNVGKLFSELKLVTDNLS